MTVTATAPARTSRAWTPTRVVACFVLLGWVLALVPAVSGIEESASYAHLQRDLRSGQVDEVRVTGDILGSDEAGYSVVTVHWRQGWRGFATEVVQVQGDDVDQPPKDLTKVRGSIADDLLELRPGLAIEREPLHATSNATLLGDQVTGAWAWVVVVLFIASLGLLVTGPEPRRATRWAWFWLWSVVPPLFVIAFLALGGSVSGREHVGGRRGRLTGGWAFLIALVLGGATSAGMR